MALELVPVRLNAVTSGLIGTPLLYTAAGAVHDTIANHRAAMLPGRRVGLVGEVAQVIRMLMTRDSIPGEMGKGLTPVALAPHMMAKTACETAPPGSMVR
jgi:NAD(P)-dependent dehydrogenase (short-subunit alcohol dehydrogenase family)